MGNLLNDLQATDFMKIQRNLDGWRFSVDTVQRWGPKDNLKGWRVYLGDELPSGQTPQSCSGYFCPHYGKHPKTGQRNDEMIGLFFVDANGNCVEYYVEYNQLKSSVDLPSKLYDVMQLRNPDSLISP